MFKKFLFLTFVFLFSLSPAFAADLSQAMSGRILLQVEQNGEAWYVYPKNNERYFLGRPSDAFNIMRQLGLGVSDPDCQKFLSSQAPARLSGYILINVEQGGKAYYVNPSDLKLHYLGRPADAFSVMRQISLGISDKNLEQIKTSQNSAPLIVAKADLFLVVRIVDGDTIELENGDRVRYIGIDTPEKGDPYYSEASRANSALVLNKKVRLEKDISETDRYNRLLRYVYVGDLFVNLELVNSGFAKSYTYPPDIKYSDQFVSAQSEARILKKGLWADYQESDHAFYTSGHYSSEYYYCDTDPARKNLSEKYLESFSSEADLLKKYPSKSLHAPC